MLVLITVFGAIVAMWFLYCNYELYKNSKKERGKNEKEI